MSAMAAGRLSDSIEPVNSDRNRSGEAHASAGIWLVSADPWRHHGLWTGGGADCGFAGTLRARGEGGGEGGFRISPDPGRLDLLGGLDPRRLHGGALDNHQAADRS